MMVFNMKIYAKNIDIHIEIRSPEPTGSPKVRQFRKDITTTGSKARDTS